MNNIKQNIVPLTLLELFDDASYIIPIYQRNYAWGTIEIEQLIQDIYDQSTQHQDKNYYLGSLVVSKRDSTKESLRNVYETIDGQQRHTSLSIILAVLKHKYDADSEIIKFKPLNLHFDNRNRSEETLQLLYKSGKKDDLSDLQEFSMLNAYVIIDKYLNKLFGDEPFNKNTELQKLWQYFSTKVIILRSPVPQKTDLNHYFEIMNNRGEQLEKHEVLKARLMKSIATEKQYTFGKIWDACAYMDKYVQYSFDTDIRKKIFGEDLKNTRIVFSEINGFEEIVSFFRQTKEKNNVSETIKDNDLESIFKKAKVTGFGNNSKNKSEEGDERYGSIISFPNFLLHTLKILKKGGAKESQYPLDDKRLLTVFENNNVDAEEFIIALLKARFLFDKYIIKRERNKDWCLKRITYSNTGKKSSISFPNTFAKDNDERSEGDTKHINHRIKMLLAMLHVSFPQMTYKNWLNGILNYLFNENNQPTAEAYLCSLEKYNDRIFYGLFGKEHCLTFHQIIYTDDAVAEHFDEKELKKKTNIQNYIFNRLDWAIWSNVMYYNNNIAVSSKRDEFAETCLNFSFSLRSSVEHHYPQNPIDGQPALISADLSNGVDSFGNLCLISSSTNSRLGNLMPKEKRGHYLLGSKNQGLSQRASINVESLKQQIMMSYENWDSKHALVIKEHEDEVIVLLKVKYSEAH
ncbi:MAG: hypothetical protein OFPII_00790 [Osedax symbiont Rs1]|nr:MAG: hypothetical protein OFPII_00790 [Osedax symbiont Rs1]